MPEHDLAHYVGNQPEYAGQIAEVRPDIATYNLPLKERYLFARWQCSNLSNHASKLGQTVGTCWHKFPVTDFRIMVAIRVSITV